MQKKRILVLISSIIIGIILLISLLIFLGVPLYPLTREYCGCHDMIPNYYFITFGILLILAAIPISYYFSLRKMEDELKEHRKILTKFAGKKIKRYADNNTEKQTVLNFLNSNERKILERLLEHNGIATQSEISKMDKMTKLKTHRAVKNLEAKAIIKKEKYGKTNKLILNKEIENLLKD